MKKMEKIYGINFVKYVRNILIFMMKLKKK